MDLALKNPPFYFTESIIYFAYAVKDTISFDAGGVDTDRTFWASKPVILLYL